MHMHDNTWPVRILQPYVVIENHSDGATRPRKKFDDIYPFQYNTGVWRTRNDSKDRASIASR